MQSHRHELVRAQKLLSQRHFGPIKPSSHMVVPKPYKSAAAAIGLSKLKRILHLDTANQTILVQPGITMEELVDKTLAHGLIPPVVPEFKGITVGGAVNGAALESSSHRFGQFSDICLSYEVMLGDGSVVTASPSENPDIFYGISGSFGTVGFLTAAELRLIPAKSWVRIDYKRFSSIEQAVSYMGELQTPDMLEAIVFSSDNTVVVTGTFLEDPGNLKRLKFSSPWDVWFFGHVETTDEAREAVPIRDYLFRHDRGAFWMGGYVPRLPFIKSYIFPYSMPHFRPLCPNRIFRLLFGHLFSSKRLYSRLKENYDWIKERFVIQDFYLPKENCAEFVNQVIKDDKITPIWLCPVKSTTTPQLFSPHKTVSEQLLFDVGVYGLPWQGDGPETVRKLETLCARFNGKKMLYSLNSFSKEEFWSLYPQEKYRQLREKTRFASLVPDIAEKLTI